MRPDAERPSEEPSDNAPRRRRSGRESRIISAAHEKKNGARCTLYATTSPLYRAHSISLPAAVTASGELSPQGSETYPMSHGATAKGKTPAGERRITVVESQCREQQRCAGDSRTAIQRGVSVVQTPPPQKKTLLLRPHAADVDAGRKGGDGRRRRGTRLSSATTRVAACVDSNLHERSQEAR